MARPAVATPPRIPHGGDVFELGRGRGLDPRSIIDFSSNINPLGPPRSVLNALEGSAWMLPHYPDASYRRFRNAAAEYSGVPSAGNVVEGNGATELIYLLPSSLLRKGDRVLIPCPAFGEYERSVLIAGAEPVHLLARAPGFALEPARVLGAIEDSGCRAIFIASPNNPTSRTVARDDLLKILDAASSKGALVFLDEAFIEFTESNGMADKVDEYQNLFILRSLTKMFSVAGLRVGYGLASRKLAAAVRDSKPTWSMSVLAQEAGIAALGDRPFVRRSAERLRREGRRLCAELKRIGGVAVVEPEANFILLRLPAGMTAPEVKARLLRERRILVRDCSDFGGLDDRYVRVAVKLRAQNSLLVEALREVLHP